MWKKIISKFRWHCISVWSLVYVSCKFEMYILEIAQVIGENVPIAFLYVLSILLSAWKAKSARDSITHLKGPIEASFLAINHNSDMV